MAWCQTIILMRHRKLYIIVDERIRSLDVFTKCSANNKLAPYHRPTKTTDSSEKRNIISTYIINCHRLSKYQPLSLPITYCARATWSSSTCCH